MKNNEEDFWGVDFELSDFDFDMDDESKDMIVKVESVPARCIKYENAVKLAKKVDMTKADRYDCIVKGNFIFGDFIEAFFVENNIYTDELTISTLSLSRDNVDSLWNLISGGYVGHLRLLCSVYFYANERGTNGIIGYLFSRISKEYVSCCFADVHTKIVTFKTKKSSIIIKGSANLRSNSCVEEFTIENNKDVFEFYDGYHNQLFEKSKETEKGQVRKKEIIKFEVEES